ncbi:MAG: hypothetical protein ABUT39_15385 [Acidobacteriota bacterium]
MTPSKSFFWLVLAFCALCVMAGAATFALSGEAASDTALNVAGVAFLVAAAILWREGRRDPDAVLTLVGAFALLAAVCIGIYLFYADRPGTASQVALVVCVALGVACGAATWRRQRTESADFPDVLATMVLPASIFETEGIQLTGLLDQGRDRRPHAASILLQNCFDAPRTVTIRFDAAGAEKYMRFHPEHRVEIGPAEVARVVFPVVAPTYPGSYPLYFSIAVEGRSGKRVRLRRAQEATERTKAATTVALLVVGHLMVGGGIRFTIGPLPYDIWAAELPQPVRQSLWQPRIGTVPFAQPAA